MTTCLRRIEDLFLQAELASYLASNIAGLFSLFHLIGNLHFSSEYLHA